MKFCDPQRVMHAMVRTYQITMGRAYYKCALRFSFTSNVTGTKTTTMSVHQSTSDHGIYNQCQPFLLYGIQLHYTAILHIHGNWTNCIYLRRPVMSLLFPTLPKQPGLTLQHFVFLYTLSPSYILVLLAALGAKAWWTPSTKLSTLIRCRRWEIGDLGWCPRTRHLVLIFIPLFLWGGNHAASKRPAGVYIHTHIGRSGEQGQASNINFTAISIQVEAWYKRQTGQDRHSRQILFWVSEQ